MTVSEATASNSTTSKTPKRTKVASGLFRRTKDGVFEVGYSLDGRYHLETLRDPAGRPITSQREAEKAQRAKLVKADEGQGIAPSRVSFDELATIFFEGFAALVASGERKQRSLDDYRFRYERYLKARIGRVQAQRITRQHILDVLNELRRDGLSTSTLHAVYRTFAVIVGEGRERNILNVDIRLGKRRIAVKNSRAIRKLNDAEVKAVVEATAPRWKALVVTAAVTGARASELLGLTWADLNLAEGEASISITKQLGRDGSLIAPKTINGTRTVRIGDGLRRALLVHYNQSHDKRPEAFVFAQDTQAVGRYGLARRAFTAAVNRAGIEFDPTTEKVSLHCFRHAAAKRMLRDGLDVQRVALNLGDTVATVVATYLRSEERDKATEQDPAVLDIEVAA